MDNVLFFINGRQIINGSKVIKITQIDDDLVFDCDRGLYNPRVKFSTTRRAELFMEKMVDRLSKLPVNHRLIICVDDDINTNEEGEQNETNTINDNDAC